MSFVDVWGEYNKARDANQRQSLGALQQAQAVQGILAQQQQMAARTESAGRERELRGALASLTPEQQADPVVMRGLYMKYASPHDALTALKPVNPLENASPLRKLIMERDAAAKAGQTDLVKLYDAQIAKTNQTEGGQTQEMHALLLDVKQRHERGENIPRADWDKATLAYQHLNADQVLPSGVLVKRNYGDQFNPQLGFGRGMPTAPQQGVLGARQPTPAPAGVLSATPPAMDADRQPVPGTAGVPMQPVNSEQEAISRFRAAGGTDYGPRIAPMRMPLGEPTAVPAPASAPPINPNARAVVVDRKKYVREMPDGQGGWVGVTIDGKMEQIPPPPGVRSDLRPGQVWNEEKQRAEWRPNTPEYAKQSNAHAKDWNTTKAAESSVALATGKVDELLDKKNESAFNSLFGGYNALATQFLPGQTQDAKATLATLKANLKSAGKEMIVNAGGTSIGQITEREWPILEQQIEAITPLMSESKARDALDKIKTQMRQMANRIKRAYDIEWGDTQFYKAGTQPPPGDKPDAKDGAAPGKLSPQEQAELDALRKRFNKGQ